MDVSRFTVGFRSDAPVVQIRFGPGARHGVAEEVDSLGARRALVLSTPEQREAAEAMAEALGDKAAGVFAGAVMHTPVAVSDNAAAYARDVGADCTVAIGGGSTIGLGKAITLRTDLPQIAIPTTYAGSEATPVIGQSEGGKKTTQTAPKVQPVRIIYDPELVATLPPAMTVTSGLNAIAHAAEALYARDRNPLATSLALSGIRLFVDSLPKVMDNPADLAARADTLFGAWHCGAVLAQVGMALHHKLCHTLGGSFDLPHAQTHAIVLPHAVAYNEVAVPEQLAPLAQLLDAPTAGEGLHRMAERLGAPMALKDLGLAEPNLDKAVEIALQNQYWNPRPIEAAPLRALLGAAWAGDRPAT